MCIASDFGFVLFHMDHSIFLSFYFWFWARAAGVFNAVEYIAEGGSGSGMTWCSGNIVGFLLR